MTLTNKGRENVIWVITTFKSAIVNHSGCNDEHVNDLETQYTNIGLDSLDWCEVCMHLESEFDIHLPDSVASQTTTLSQLLHACTRQLVAKKVLTPKTEKELFNKYKIVPSRIVTPATIAGRLQQHTK